MIKIKTNNFLKDSWFYGWTFAWCGWCPGLPWYAKWTLNTK